MCNTPNLDLVNMNACIKFGGVLKILSGNENLALINGNENVQRI